jgi:predicted nucleotidyltransferase
VPPNERSEPGGKDKTIYSLRKWTSLAVQGNPTALLPLFVPSEALHIVTKFGYEVRNERGMFLSQRCITAFRGYLTKQLHDAFSDAKHTNRPELVEEFGFDTKAAYHALRVAIQGRELIETHDITIPMQPYWQSFLVGVRKGRFTLTEVLRELEKHIALLDYAAEHTTLPEHCDMTAIDTWLTGMYVTYWKEQQWV